MIFITVVIPTYNRSKILNKCLEAFRNQTYPPECYEIIVVDDGSSDGTKELLEEASKSMPNLRYFTQTQGGPAKARNLGVQHAKGSIMLFTGDDCLPEPRLLEEHNNSHQKDRNVAVLGRIEWHPDLEITPFMELIGNTFQFCYPTIEKESNSVSFYFFYTSNISIRKDVLSNTGPFDEDFKDAAFEDTEMGYRIWRAGIRTVYNRRALTYHYHPVTMQNFIERQIKSGRAAALLYAKHPEMEEFTPIADLVKPETREDFYLSSMRYYFAVGVQEGLRIIEKDLIQKRELPVALEDILKRWSLKSADRLLKMVKDERNRIQELRSEINKREKRLGENASTIHKMHERINWLELELKHYREFVGRVKASLPYRFYKSIQYLLGRARD